ncbi:tRNA (adenosine(37)-N6)-threonylcarbamoyltransferase complex dimerization subunit type 1 TsaB [bacterium]|nr:tRNA (adenosine(37)-N6)-threonylcarbamoyltransferase complex dimerization subunit type 1 TsaB [bacterium]
MNILAFDTCLNRMFVAVGDENGVFSSKVVETTESTYHSAFLISTIVEMLKACGLTPAEIDVVATNRGPGSFTGIRCCTTVARVLAQARDLKAIGVSSLEILSRINKSNKKTFVALDARKNKAYVAIYDNGKEIFSPQAVEIEKVEDMLKNDDYCIISDKALSSKFGGFAYEDINDDLGIYLVKIASEKLAENCETNWRKLMPLYIQPPAMNVKKTPVKNNK